jgi:hypothetical protein
MKSLKRFGIISTLGLMVILAWSSVGVSHNGHSKVQMDTKPPIAQLLPFEAGSHRPQSPTQITVWAIGETELPVNNAKIRLQLLAPSPTPWLTTDFPIVEGTKLLEIEAMAPNGELQIQQMLPIRGTYQVVVDAAPVIPNQFEPIHQTLALSVGENGSKYRNAAILVAVLLAIGFAGGWIIAAPQTIRPGEVAPRRVQLLLSGAAVLAIAALLIVNLTSASGHEHTHTHAPEVAPATQTSQGLTLELSGDTEAIVGQPATQTIRIQDATTGRPVQNVLLKIQAISLEDGWTAFAYQGMPDAAGQLTWQQQFFDGAPHQVSVEVLPQPNSSRQFQPLRVEHSVDVEAIQPPLTVQLITLAYGTLIFWIGLAIGFKVRRSQKM